MQTGSGYLTKWTVANEPGDNGDDHRQIIAEFVVPDRGPISMAVAAVSNQPCRLTAALPLEAAHALENVPCEIRPPWGAKKRGGFQFRAVMPYSEDMVMGLMAVTQGMAMKIGIEIVQTEAELDDEMQPCFAFVAGGKESA